MDYCTKPFFFVRTLVCTAPGHFLYQDRKSPEPTPGRAILRIRRIGICGTDLHAYEGTQPYFTYPRVLGHELSGELVSMHDTTGEAARFSIGQAVTIIPYFHCGTCGACRVGKPNCCVQLQVAGVHIDGGMADFLSVPLSALVHGSGLSYDELALVEPLAIGAHGIRRANVRSGEWVLVTGAGPIGLGLIEFAKIAGARVIVMDVNAGRLQFCRDRLGVAHTIQAADANVTEQLIAITDGDMATVIIDATGNLRAIDNAFSYLAHGGRYVLVGLQKGGITVNHPEFHKREATLMSSRNATRADFDHVITSMQAGLIDPAAFITHRVCFNEVATEFAGWLNPVNSLIKAMVTVSQ